MVEVHDPLGRRIATDFCLTEDGRAAIEMANASGLRLLRQDEFDPLHSNSFGTGELIRCALDMGAVRSFWQ